MVAPGGDEMAQRREAVYEALATAGGCIKNHAAPSMPLELGPLEPGPLEPGPLEPGPLEPGPLGAARDHGTARSARYAGLTWRPPTPAGRARLGRPPDRFPWESCGSCATCANATGVPQWRHDRWCTTWSAG